MNYLLRIRFWLMALFLLPFFTRATVFDIPLWASLIYYFSIPVVLIVVFFPLKYVFSWKTSIALTVFVYLLIGTLTYWQLVTIANIRNSPVDLVDDVGFQELETSSRSLNFYLVNIFGWPLSVSQQIIYPFVQFPNLQY